MKKPAPKFYLTSWFKKKSIKQLLTVKNIMKKITFSTRPVKSCSVKCVSVRQPHSDLWLFVFARRVLHHHSVVPVEGDRHHAGQLSAPLHPEVPTQTLLPAQLLQADHLKTESSLQPHFLWGSRKVSLSSSRRPENQTRIHPLQFVLKSWNSRLGNVEDGPLCQGRVVYWERVTCYMWLLQRLTDEHRNVLNRNVNT